MPSIQDVADQINVKLDLINQNTAATVSVGNSIRTDIAQVNAKLNTLDGDLQAGTTSITNGLFAIWELQKATKAVLDHHTKQNDTIICLIENSNELLCGITRKLTRQLDVSEQLLKALKRVEGIAERTQPGAAGDFDRLSEIQKELRECCPPEEPKLEPCPEACRVSKPEPYNPKGQDWKPMSNPKLG
jgi:hypothetical protein